HLRDRVSAQRRLQTLKGLCFAENSSAVTPPIVLDAKLSERLLRHPAPGAVERFDQQDKVRDAAAQLAHRNVPGSLDQSLSREIVWQVSGCDQELFVAHGCPRNSTSALLNSCGFSICGTCPHRSKTTSLAPEADLVENINVIFLGSRADVMQLTFFKIFDFASDARLWQLLTKHSISLRLRIFALRKIVEKEIDRS